MRNKLIAILCSTFMIFSVTTVSASVIDFSQYSDEEVTEILAEVNQEISNRGILKTAHLEKGIYLVGRDIPAGTYTLHCIYNESDGAADCSIYSDYNDMGWDTILDYIPVFPADYDTLYDRGELTRVIRLEEGYGVSIDYPMDLTIFKGVIFE